MDIRFYVIHMLSSYNSLIPHQSRQKEKKINDNIQSLHDQHLPNLLLHCRIPTNSYHLDARTNLILPMRQHLQSHARQRLLSVLLHRRRIKMHPCIKSICDDGAGVCGEEPNDNDYVDLELNVFTSAL